MRGEGAKDREGKSRRRGDVRKVGKLRAEQRVGSRDI